MTVGDPSIFAVESGITRAYERLSFRALGFFVIHIGGSRFGVHKPDATMLACSFDEVGRRLLGRGKHTAPFAVEPDGGKIASAFRDAVYAEEPVESYFGVMRAEFSGLFNRNSNGLMWAPDGDEAFDDSSYVLQFDVDDRVRLIAFKSDEAYGHDPATLRDVWLPAADFYRILQQWHDGFEAEWTNMPKVSIDHENDQTV